MVTEAVAGESTASNVLNPRDYEPCVSCERQHLRNARSEALRKISPAQGYTSADF